MTIADDDAREETEEVKVEEDGGMEAEEVDVRTVDDAWGGSGRRRHVLQRRLLQPVRGRDIQPPRPERRRNNVRPPVKLS